MTLIVKPKVLVRFLAVTIACLSIAHFVSQYLKHVGGYKHQWWLERQFNLVNEANVPAWDSVMALSLSVLLLTIAAACERQAGGRDARHWTGHAGIFFCFSLDEVAQIHEKLTDRSVLCLDGRVEEALEMSGIALFVYGVSSCLARSGATFSLHFADDMRHSVLLSSAPTSPAVDVSEHSAA